MSRSRYEAQIREVLGSRQDETAVDCDGISFSWREAQEVAASVKRLLEDTGIPEFGRVGLIARNRPFHIATLWGIFVSGRCTSMVHAFQPPDPLALDIAENRWPIVIGERR